MIVQFVGIPFAFAFAGGMIEDVEKSQDGREVQFNGTNKALREAILGATSVVTTASDAIGTLTVDILGRELGWELDDPDRHVTRGCAAPR